MLTCSRERIALQGLNQEKIDFSSPPTANEVNFVAVVRLLAKNNAIWIYHSVSGPINVMYTSKTIHNEIMEVAVTV